MTVFVPDTSSKIQKFNFFSTIWKALKIRSFWHQQISSSSIRFPRNCRLYFLWRGRAGIEHSSSVCVFSNFAKTNHINYKLWTLNSELWIVNFEGPLWHDSSLLTETEWQETNSITRWIKVAFVFFSKPWIIRIWSDNNYELIHMLALWPSSMQAWQKWLALRLQMRGTGRWLGHSLLSICWRPARKKMWVNWAGIEF